MLEIRDGYEVFARGNKGEVLTLSVQTVAVATVDVTENGANVTFGQRRKELFSAELGRPIPRILAALLGEDGEEERPLIMGIDLVNTLEDVESVLKERLEAFVPYPDDLSSEERTGLLATSLADMMREIRGQEAYWKARDTDRVDSAT